MYTIINKSITEKQANRGGGGIAQKELLNQDQMQ